MVESLPHHPSLPFMLFKKKELVDVQDSDEDTAVIRERASKRKKEIISRISKSSSSTTTANSGKGGDEIRSWFRSVKSNLLSRFQKSNNNMTVKKSGRKVLKLDPVSLTLNDNGLVLPFDVAAIIHSLMIKDSIIEKDGLFRIPGSRVRVESARAQLLAFEMSGSPLEDALMHLERLPEHDKASLLKRCLSSQNNNREMDISLDDMLILVETGFSELESSWSSHDGIASQLIAFSILAKPNMSANLCLILLAFLHNVSRKNASMPSENLSIIFAPYLFPSSTMQVDSIGKTVSLLKKLIDYYPHIGKKIRPDL